MSQNIEERLKGILLNLLQQADIHKNVRIDLDGDIADYPVNSRNFVQFIVAIEEEFDIEFDDSELNYELFKTPRQLLDTIQREISMQ